MFPSLVADFGKLTGRGIKVGWEPPTFVAYEDPDRALRALSELLDRSGPITVDIEVGFEKDTEFDHPDHYQMLCVGIGYAPGRVVVIGETACSDPLVGEQLGRVLTVKNVICHNGKFDLAGLRRYTTGARLYGDTMLASYVMDERRGVHGLKYLAKEHFGTPDWDVEMKAWTQGGSYANAPRELLYRYNAVDCAVTYDLWEMYDKQMAEEGLRDLHDFLCRASDALQQSEVEGIGVDLEQIPLVAEESESKLEELRTRLAEIAGHPINPNSPKQVEQYFANKGIKVPTTNKEMLKALIDRGHEVEFSTALLAFREEAKFYGTYVKGIRQRVHRGRVYPTFLLHGTVSGRLSCRNPNMQNIPRGSKARRLFVPQPGNVFVQGDYAQAELRVIATLAQDEYLREVFAEGRDLHGEVAERFYGPGWTKEQRVRAKAVVFGLSYGREAPSLAAEFKIPVAEAQRYLDTFFAAIPSTVVWRKEMQQRVLDGEDLVTPFGRRRRFWLITRDNKKDIMKECLSFMPQSIASDICLSSLIRLRNMGFSVRIPVHDSILVECAEEDAQDVAHAMKEVMEQTAIDTFTDYVPFPVDVAIGPTWGDLG
jgi:DNA polymerase-1